MALSDWVLKISKDGDSITFPDHVFQGLTSITEAIFPHMWQKCPVFELVNFASCSFAVHLWGVLWNPPLSSGILYCEVKDLQEEVSGLSSIINNEKDCLDLLWDPADTKTSTTNYIEGGVGRLCLSAGEIETSAVVKAGSMWPLALGGWLLLHLQFCNCRKGSVPWSALQQSNWASWDWALQQH